MNYPLVAVDLLLQCIRSGSIKVILARIHPEDVVRVDLEKIGNTLMCSILPSCEVQRGYLFVDSKPARH